MATLRTAKVAAGVQPRAGHEGVLAVSATYTLAAALALNDVIEMVKVPKGAKILNMHLASDDLDTGSAAIILAVGDGTTVDRFIKGSTVAQAGGVARLGDGVTAALMSGAFGYTYTVDDTIDVKVTTAPATGTTAGDIVLTVFYMMEN